MKTADARPTLSNPQPAVERTKPTPPPSTSSTPTRAAANAPTDPEAASIHQTITPEMSVPRPPRKVSSAEFNTAMVHLYRGEITRANTWRNRLDTTTNWAVLTTGATLSFAFSSPVNPHFVILINTILVAFFLFMEARRYRYYEIWSSRVRVLETGYFAQLLTPDLPGDDAWITHLVKDLQTPSFNISEWEAVGRRLRRNYLWIFMLLAACWNLKVYMHPVPAYDFNAFIDRATIGFVPGAVIFMAGVLFNIGLLVFALATVRLREAQGEVLPHHEFHPIQRVTDWTRTATGRQQRTASANGSSTTGGSAPASATVRRAKRARERARSMPRSTGTTTGEWRRSDIHRTQMPEQTSDDIHETHLPDHEPVREETLT